MPINERNKPISNQEEKSENTDDIYPADSEQEEEHINTSSLKQKHIGRKIMIQTTLGANLKLIIPTPASLPPTARVCSQNTAKINRRLDSLARILEQDSTCVAVAYDEKNAKLLIATNNIHKNSRQENALIAKIKKAMELLSGESNDNKTTIIQLADIIRANIQQENRLLINTIITEKAENIQSQNPAVDINKAKEVARNEFTANLKHRLIALLKDLSQSNKKIKDWTTNPNKSELNAALDTRLSEPIIRKTSRIARDFIKLKTDLNGLKDSQKDIEKNILYAINKSQYNIVRIGENSEHAERKIINYLKMVNNKTSIKPYIGISKLCCADCATATKAAGYTVRGQHGLLFKSGAIADITNLPNVATKKRRRRTEERVSMYADSSDSDYEFAIDESDHELFNNIDISKPSIKDNTILTEIINKYPNEFYVLQILGANSQEIIDIYNQSKDKFMALGKEEMLAFDYNNRLLDGLAEIYDKGEQAFSDLMANKILIITYGLEEAYNAYKNANYSCEWAYKQLQDQYGSDDNYDEEYYFSNYPNIMITLGLRRALKELFPEMPLKETNDYMQGVITRSVAEHKQEKTHQQKTKNSRIIEDYGPTYYDSEEAYQPPTKRPNPTYHQPEVEQPLAKKHILSSDQTLSNGLRPFEKKPPSYKICYPRNVREPSCSNQLGWNCFDIAIGLDKHGGREALIEYALSQADNEEFRKLLASEIKSAAMLTATGSTATNTGALPSCMYTTELNNLVGNYLKAQEKMKTAVATCNDALGNPDGKRIPLIELELFFSIEENRRKYQEAYNNFMTARNTIYKPHERTLEDFCHKKEIYEQYICEYYGKNSWFSFQLDFKGERTSTSMVDIAARMLNKTIAIYQGDKEIYRTNNIGESEIYVDYNGCNHFWKRETLTQQQESAISARSVASCF